MSIAATNQPMIENENGVLTVFTFWIGDELFAIDIDNILSVTQDMENLLQPPVKSRGLMGVINYMDEPVAVYNFAEMLNIASTRNIKEGLVELLNASEQDHIDWLDALEKSLKEDVPFEKERDARMCDFSKWYTKFKTRDEALTDIVANFEKPHKEIHALADELLGLKENDKLEEALEKLEKARMIKLEYLKKYFDHARSQIEESLHTVVINITNDGAKPLVALQIDEIHEVMNFNQSDLRGLDKIGLDAVLEMEGLFKGYLGSQDNRSSCLLLDTANLLSSVKVE